jgi:hypothetical protein
LDTELVFVPHKLSLFEVPWRRGLKTRSMATCICLGIGIVKPEVSQGEKEKERFM